MRSCFHILIIGQRERRYQSLEDHLIKAGYHVCVQPDSTAALQSLTTQQPDLVLLGPSLPVDHSLALCCEIRKQSRVPLILFIHPHQLDAFVYSLQQGADAVISTSLILKEVEARITAVLRRAYLLGQARLAPPLHIGDIILDEGTRTVTVANQPVFLTRIEYQLLDYLMQQANCTVSKAELYRKIWGKQQDKTLNIVEVAIRRLRQKIEPDPAAPTYLITRNGEGYQFIDPHQQPVA